MNDIFIEHTNRNQPKEDTRRYESYVKPTIKSKPKEEK